MKLKLSIETETFSAHFVGARSHVLTARENIDFFRKQFEDSQAPLNPKHVLVAVDNEELWRLGVQCM